MRNKNDKNINSSSVKEYELTIDDELAIQELMSQGFNRIQATKIHQHKLKIQQKRSVPSVNIDNTPRVKPLIAVEVSPSPRSVSHIGNHFLFDRFKSPTSPNSLVPHLRDERESIISRHIPSYQPTVPSVLSSAEKKALQFAILLSQQEKDFGFNMFDAMTPADGGEIEMLLSQGYSLNDSVLSIFERRYIIGKQ